MCSLKDSQTFFTQFFPLYTLYLFFMLSNDNIVDTKKPDEIIHLLLLWINFQDYFCIHHSFLLNIQDCINNKWRFIRFSVLIKLRKKYFSAFRRRHNTAEIFTFTCYFMFQVFWFLRNFFVLKDNSNSKNDDDDDDDDDDDGDDDDDELLLCYV